MQANDRGNGERRGESAFDVLLWRNAQVFDVDFKLRGQAYPCRVILTLSEEALQRGEPLFVILLPEAMALPHHRALTIGCLDDLESLICFFRSLVELGPEGFSAWADFLCELVERSRPFFPPDETQPA